MIKYNKYNIKYMLYYMDEDTYKKCRLIIDFTSPIIKE